MLTKYLKASLGMIFDIAVRVPLIHLTAVLKSPKNFLQILLVGPALGWLKLLMNPKSLLASAITIGGICAFFPTATWLACIGFGLATNLLNGFCESVAKKVEHQSLMEANAGCNGMLDAIGTSELYREKIPHNIGPIPNALYYSFAYADKLSFPGTVLPHSAELVHQVAVSMSGLTRSKI